MTADPKSGDTTVKIVDPAWLTAAELVKQLAPSCQRIEVAGAVRRRCRKPACIDLVVIPKIEPGTAGAPDHNYLWQVLDYFMADGGYLMRGDVVRSILRPLVDGSGMIPVNIYTATAETWGNQMVLRTGPEGFWFAILARLKGRGYISVDGKICRMADGCVVPVLEETDLFHLAGWLTKEPWQRGAPDKPMGTW